MEAGRVSYHDAPVPRLLATLTYKIMSYKEQMKQWIKEHPEATAEEAWEAGYVTCTTNWCNQQR